MLAASLIFVLLAISVSCAEVVYTAWLHDLKDGLFALLFAVLSTRAALSWCLWRYSCQLSAVSGQQDPGLPKTRERGDTVS